MAHDIGAGQKAVGVSHSAVFRHFSSKRDVLTAFAIRSARQMAAFIENAIQGVRQDRKFLAVGVAYVDYARQNPGPFRIIFREDILEETHPDYIAAMDELSTMLAIGEHGGGNDLAITPQAMLAWSSVHGLAMLCVDGSLKRDVPLESLDNLIERTLLQLSPVLRP